MFHVTHRSENCNSSKWKRLSSVSVHLPLKTWKKHCYPMCSYYVDVDGKEWIIILVPPRPIAKHTSSYLYDVENDKFLPFIKNYYSTINKRFGITHVFPEQATTSMSYVIDNDNHILYWLHSSCIQRSLLSIDIKNLQTIKLIDQTLLPFSINGVVFRAYDYTMLIAGNTIQFISGNCNCTSTVADEELESVRNFQFDIKTKKLSLIHKNIHLKSGVQNSVIKRLKLDNLKIGDYIDVKDEFSDWYLAKICDIKDMKFYNYSSCKCRSMSIFVHYVDWSTQWDEWIYVTRDENVYTAKDVARLKTSLTRFQAECCVEFSIDDIISKIKNGISICDCREQCVYNDITSTLSKVNSGVRREFNNCHRIALPKSQSLYGKNLNNLRGLYSKHAHTMIMIGQNGDDKHAKKSIFAGLYCKRLSHDKKHYQCVIYGFIRQFEQLFIPKDLCQMIFKYYFIPNEKNWTYMTKKDENDLLIQEQYDKSFGGCYSQFAVIHGNDDSDDFQRITIYKFGGSLFESHGNRKINTINRVDINMKTHSYTIKRLTNITCPQFAKEYGRMHVVFCQKSQTIHLFGQKFDKHYSIKLETLSNAQTAEN